LECDIWGLVAMPFYRSTEKLQWVARYTYLDSDGPNGLRLGRYERELVSGSGDQYQEAYLGANYFFYGHKLKWQSGLQYAEMKDRQADGGRYRGWAFTTGLRVYWY
jgi:phosphate-selective porin OprO/OprP